MCPPRLARHRFGADDTTLQLLGYLAAHLAGLPVLEVGASRDTDAPGKPPA
jgi:hypothetical protein